MLQAETRRRIDRLRAATASENWDFDGAEAIPDSEWNEAATFAMLVGIHSAITPHPSPCGDGSTHLRWSDGRRWIEIEQAGGTYAWTTSSGEVAEDKTRVQALAATEGFLRNGTR